MVKKASFDYPIQNDYKEQRDKRTIQLYIVN
jgi:hypothetical protein